MLQNSRFLSTNEAIDHQEDIIETLGATPVGLKNIIITKLGALLKINNYQTNRICRLEGRLEARTTTTAHHQTKEETKEPEKKTTKKKERNYALAVYPKENMQSNYTKTIIRRGINIANTGITVKAVKKINKGGIIIETENKDDIDEIIRKIEEKPKLKKPLQRGYPLSDFQLLLFTM